MKPRTKLQKRVMDAFLRCPLLTEERKTRAFNAVIPRIAKYTKTTKTMCCLICGHTWNAENADEVTCPCCGRELKVDHSAKRNYKTTTCVSFSDAVDDFQVVTVMYAYITQRKGEAAKFFMDVAYQRWITEDGHSEIVARKRCMNYYKDIWNWGSLLEIRCEHHYDSPYNLFPAVVFNADSVTEVLRRNGFDGDFHDNNPHFILMDLLKSPKHETLWKAGYYEMTRKDIRDIERWWSSIRIAIRNHYEIHDPSLWMDYLKDLNELGKDVRNPKFICPEDLREAHQHSQEQVTNKRLREAYARALERQREEAMTDEERQIAYENAKSKFFSLCFIDEELMVRPLKSIQEFFEEAEAMKHCVYANKYYNKQDSLIMSVTSSGDRVATIEFSLKDMSILQCRAKCNGIPEEKARIEALIMSHVNEIMKAATA